jgi:hypothetical protein
MVHHLGIVGGAWTCSAALRRGGRASPDRAIQDPIQRIVVQFYKVPESSELWGSSLIGAQPIRPSPVALPAGASSRLL